MRLPFFRTKSAAEVPPKPGRPARGQATAALTRGDEGPVQEARTRARRRLIGALVLLVVGVVGFPVLFETQPRPLSMDTPILLPQGSAPRGATAAPLPAVPGPKPLPAPPPDAGNESAATPVPAKAAVINPEPVKPEPPNPDPPKPEPAKAETPKPEPARAEPAKAPPGDQEAAATAAGRFVVQVGAFTDAERLRAARLKLEKQGFKTYTQEIQTAIGKSTRVRVGPYANRQEADAVAAKIKASGMQANILTL